MSNVTKTIEEIRAEAKAAVEAKLKAAKIEAEIKLLTSEAFQDAQVRQALRDQATEHLQSLINQCTLIVNENPVMSKVLKQQRTFNPSYRYGLGNQIALLTGLLSGIQYSVQEHSQLMYEVTGLTPDLVESTLQSLGTLSYWSKNNNVIVEGTPADAAALTDNVTLIESILGITIDKSQVKQSLMDRQEEIAYVKAEQAQAEAEAAESLQHFVIK